MCSVHVYADKFAYLGCIAHLHQAIPRKDQEFQVTGPSLWMAGTSNPNSCTSPLYWFGIRVTLRRCTGTFTGRRRLMPNCAVRNTRIMPVPRKAGKKSISPESLWASCLQYVFHDIWTVVVNILKLEYIILWCSSNVWLSNVMWPKCFCLIVFLYVLN